MVRRHLRPVPSADATSEPSGAEPIRIVASCSCLVCRAASSAEAADQLEHMIMHLIDDFLEARWQPSQIVEEMSRRVQRGTHAVDVVQLALICRAGSWLSVPGQAAALDEVDEIADARHDYVGTVIPGWLAQWLANEVGAETGLGGVVDVLELLPDALE